MGRFNLMFWLFAILSATALVYANLDGPPPGYSGAPGEGTCSVPGCHDTHAGFASVGVIATGPQNGDTVGYRVSLYGGPSRTDWGFQLTVLDSLDQPFGEIVVTDSVRTRLIAGPTGRPYLTHTAEGVPGGVGYSSWDFEWVRPSGASTTDAIRFYVSGLVADGDGTAASDAATASLTEGPICLVALTGDVNLSSSLTTADIIQLLGYCFKNGAGPQPCTAAGDVNCDVKITAADIIYLVNHLFRSGPPPCDVCQLIIDGTWDC